MTERTLPGAYGHHHRMGWSAGTSAAVEFTKNLPAETLVSRGEYRISDNETRYRGHGELKIELKTDATKFEVFHKAAGSTKWQAWGNYTYSARTFQTVVYSGGSQDGDQYRIVATVGGRTYTSATTTVKIVSPSVEPTFALEAPDTTTLPNTPGGYWGQAVPVTLTVTNGGSLPAHRVMATVTRDGFDGWTGWGLSLDSSEGDVAVYKGTIHAPTAGAYKLGYEFLSGDVANVKDIEQEPSRTFTVLDASDSNLTSVSSVQLTADANVTAGKPTTLRATVAGGGSIVSAGTITFYEGFSYVGTGTYADGAWTIRWTPMHRASTARPITARYTNAGHNAKSSTPVPVTVGDFELRFSVTGGTGGAPTVLDPITVGDSTEPLTKDDTELTITSPDDLALSEWRANIHARFNDNGDATPPVVTVDGDDNRIRISAPAGTTPGTYGIRFAGRVGNGWADPEVYYSVEIKPADVAAPSDDDSGAPDGDSTPAP